METVEKKLKDFFAKRGGVEVAYLFGSSTRQGGGFKNDVDVAVLLNEEELREGVLKKQMRIFSELSSLLRRDDVDVVILNDAPPLLQHEVIKHGEVLFERNPERRYEFETRAELNYLDLKPMRDHHWESFFRRIKGKDMPIEDEVICNLLEIINTGVERLKGQQKLPFEEYVRNWKVQDVVERELQKSIQACIDIGARLIAQKGFRKAEDYHGVFEILSQEGVIPWEFAEKMKEMVGLRNVLVHEYRRIRSEEIYRHLQESLCVFEEFINHIVSFLEK